MKRTTISISALVLAFLVMAPAAHAVYGENANTGADASVEANVRVQTDLGVTPYRPLSEEEKKRLEAAREAEKKRLEAQREAAKDAAEDRREGVQATFEGNLEAAKKLFEARREAVKANFELRLENAEDDSDARQEVRAEHREDIRAETAAHASSMVQIHLDRFVGLLTAAIDRMETLIARIEARADALDAEGKNTTEARAHLAVASSELVAAESDLAGIQADLAASLSADVELTRDLLKEAFVGTRTAIESAKKHIRAAHGAIKDAVASLKAQVRVEAAAGADVD